MINKCAKKCNTLAEQRELLLISEYIYNRVKQFTQLKEFMTSQWFLMNIFDRLGSQARVKFVELKREHNFMRDRPRRYGLLFPDLLATL
jgi:hypothetical protein